MQQRIPAELLGRASSVDWLASFLGSPLGLVVVGVGAATVGTRGTMVAGGLVVALSALVLLVPGIEP
jgi:hypothetical protein